MSGDIEKWDRLVVWFEKEFKMEADVDAMLFMIGVQELGKGFVEYNKTQKLELIHVGVCSVLLKEGYYQFSHIDADGWPHYTLIKKLPYIKGAQQSAFMKKHLLDYFSEFIDSDH
jgi:hypothetical protein